MEFKKPRGTIDWYGKNLLQFNEVKFKLQNLALNFNFQEINTPTFESLNLFKKSIGEVTDITQKELYVFQDKKDRWMALRPEGTSSVVRSYVEEKMFANKSNATKLFYILNLFRYERPQSGRLREFHQFGVEYLNVTNHLYDIECLILANEIIKIFNLEKYVTLQINYLGNFKQRQEWIEELKKYFIPFKDQLTEDSQNRLNINPLRILDDKVDGKKDFVINAPKLSKFLTQEDNQVFQNILDGLIQNNIKYEINTNLVRGLDYYTGIVFEFVYTSPNNESTTIIGGGRYNDLVKQTGGPDQIGLGFAMGIERLLMALNDINYQFTFNNNPIVVIGADSYSSSLTSLKLISLLRQNNIHACMDYGNYKKDKNAKFAIKNNAKYFIYLTENDTLDDFNIETLSTNTKEKISIQDLLTRLRK